MAQVGYSYLLQQMQLPCRPLARTARISGSVTRKHLTDTELLVPRGVALDNSILGHLEFALRNEGVNLEILDALFEVLSPGDLIGRLQAQPNNQYMRRAAFLWEWLRDEELPVSLSLSAPYQDALPSDQYVVSSVSRNVQKYRIRDNMPGSRWFCPLVKKATVDSLKMSVEMLLQEVNHTLEELDADTYARAVQYLYLAETKGSYGIEKEEPSADRMTRFVELLQRANQVGPFSEDLLADLQRAIVRDVYSQEFSYRTQQNWLETNSGLLDYLPPDADSLRQLMQGWEEYVNSNEYCPNLLVKTACASFGFVYLHPFMDGNGRLHRYIIHSLLSQSHLLKENTVLPVSAVILNNIPEYRNVLVKFAHPVLRLWKYTYGDMAPFIESSPGTRPYRFFAADEEVLFLHRILCQTVQEELPRELRWLAGYDQAFTMLDHDLDLPQKDLRLLIRLAHANGGQISQNKRRQFAHLPEDVLALVEKTVREVFHD